MCDPQCVCREAPLRALRALLTVCLPLCGSARDIRTPMNSLFHFARWVGAVCGISCRAPLTTFLLLLAVGLFCPHRSATLNDSSQTEARLHTTLTLLNALLRALLARPDIIGGGDPAVTLAPFLTPDGLDGLPGFIHTLVDGVSRCLVEEHTPAVRSGAALVMLYLCSAHPNLNQNALLDFAMLHAADTSSDDQAGGAMSAAAVAMEPDPLAVLDQFDVAPRGSDGGGPANTPSAGAGAGAGAGSGAGAGEGVGAGAGTGAGAGAGAGVGVGGVQTGSGSSRRGRVVVLPEAKSGLFRTVMSLLRGRAMRRSVGHDALVLLTILLSYNRFDRRNPFLMCMNAMHTSTAVDEALSVDTRGMSLTSVDTEGVWGLAFTVGHLAGRCVDSIVADATPASTSLSATQAVSVAAGAAGHAAATVARGVVSTLSFAASVLGSSLWATSKPRSTSGLSSSHARGQHVGGANAPHGTSRLGGGRRDSGGGGTRSSSSAVGGASGAAVRQRPSHSHHTPRPRRTLRVLTSPLDLPLHARVGVVLCMFHDAFCLHPRGLAAAAAVSSWRAHARASLQPTHLPELLRQTLSVCSYALQTVSEGQTLAQLALHVLSFLTKAREDLLGRLPDTQPPSPGGASVATTTEPTSVSVSKHSLQRWGDRRNPVLLILHSHGLDRLSSTFPMFSRVPGSKGGLLVRTTDRERPVVAAVYRMVRGVAEVLCHAMLCRVVWVCPSVFLIWRFRSSCCCFVFPFFLLLFALCVCVYVCVCVCVCVPGVGVLGGLGAWVLCRCAIALPSTRATS